MVVTLDIFSLLNRLTILKAVNIIKVYFSFYLTRIIQRPIQFGKPFNLSIEPTTACNLGCPECPSGLKSFSRDTGTLKFHDFEKYLESISETLLSLTFYFQGEPYINPSFLKMVRVAEDKGIYTMTSTNGHFLNWENSVKTVWSGLSKIIISIDGTTQEVYEKYRISGKLDNVLAGIKNLVKAKKELNSQTPTIVLQFLVVKHNEHQIEEIKKLGINLGVDKVNFKTAQIYNYKFGNPLIPSKEKYSRYRKTSTGQYELKYKLRNECWKLWHSSVITWDGYVVPCCFDKDAQFNMGNLNNSSFDEIWQGEKYNNFRKKLIKGRKSISICQNCSEGCKVHINNE